MTGSRADRFGPADWVTLARAMLAVGVAAFVAGSFDRPVRVAVLVALASVALALDALDGWVARRTRTAGGFGARFDGEVDAFLILALSVYVARSTGAWVLTIGVARYAFGAAGWVLPWMREPLPPRYWRKVVTAVQGIVLTVAAADVLPAAFAQLALMVALALLAESFGRDVWWLWRHRHTTRRRAPAPAGLPLRHLRASVATGLTILALLLVWGALVAPDQPTRLEPGAFLRLPLEGLVLIAAALVLPATARRLLAWVAGPALALVVVLKVLDIGFYATFDRPFDPYQDAGYAGIGPETLDSMGGPDASLIVVGAVALAIALFALMTLAVRRLTWVAAGHRRWSVRSVAALGAVWVLCWALGAQLVSQTPIASTSAAGLIIDKGRALRADLEDPAVFAREIDHDRFRDVPTDQLLTGLRGKDVILAFVESYGKVAVRGSSLSRDIEPVLDRGARRLDAAGFSSRSAFLTSPTFGGISWLAHSTLHSGLWVDTQRRYDQLVESDRFTLSRAFKRAGWRAVDVAPSNDRDWPEGTSFYGFDRVYDSRNVGYGGPPFAYAPMPDQYVFAALRRLELAKAHRRPLFAELDLVSSHTPWTRIPQMVPWREVGDGSVFNGMPAGPSSKDALWSDPERVREAYGRSIEYTLSSLLSFVQRHGDRNLVLVLLGDHQPWTNVTGQDPSHDVPISVIAHDPAVLRRIAGPGWSDGLRPGPRAAVWPMSDFRNRFLSAFGSKPPPGRSP